MAKMEKKTQLRLWGHPSSHKKKNCNNNFEMTQHGQQLAQLSLRRRIHRRLLILRRWFRRVLDQILRCPPLKKPIRYRMLAHGTVTSSSIGTPEGGFASVENENVTPVYHHHSHDKDSDLVALKISLLGDFQIGKTSFLVCIFYFFL